MATLKTVLHPCIESTCLMQNLILKLTHDLTAELLTSLRVHVRHPVLKVLDGRGSLPFEN
jgi:hypothetical protein